MWEEGCANVLPTHGGERLLDPPGVGVTSSYKALDMGAGSPISPTPEFHYLKVPSGGMCLRLYCLFSLKKRELGKLLIT